MSERFFNALSPFLAPFVVALSFIIVAFWVKRKIPGFFVKRLSSISEDLRKKIGQTASYAFFYWFTIFGFYITTEISPIKGALQTVLQKGLMCLFIISLTFIFIRALDMLPLFFPKPKEGVTRAFFIARKIFTVILVILSIFIIFEILGLSTGPILFLVIFVLLLLTVILRDVIASFFSYIHFVSGEILRKGDYIKIETGEEGEVKDLSFASIKIRTPEDKILFFPPSKLIKMKFEVVRKPPKKAKEPFRFYTRQNIKELTGVRASNILEFLEAIKTVPDSVIFYHTHDFIEEYHYLTPQPSNEFVLWVSEALGDLRLGEKLANIDILEFSGINEMRGRIIDTIEEYLRENDGLKNKACPPGMEFHFIRSISAIMPTPYVAYDLRELAEVLKFVSPNSLFFHFYEAKLRLGKLSNDFSTWIKDSLGDEELAEKIGSLDPYMYTIEGLRDRLIRLIEEHIEREA